MIRVFIPEHFLRGEARLCERCVDIAMASQGYSANEALYIQAMENGELDEQREAYRSMKAHEGVFIFLTENYECQCDAKVEVMAHAY